MQTTKLKQIINKIKKSKDGTLFFIGSFPEYDREYVTKVLAGLAKNGTIVRLSTGIYFKPIVSSFGIVYPQVKDVVEAIAKRDNAKILPTGETAMNQLGLSTQVPMNSEYITNGSARTIKIGNRTIKLRRNVPRNFAYKGEIMPVLVMAMKAIGQGNITDEHLGRIKTLLKDYPEEKTWASDLLLAPDWIRKIIITLINN